MRHPPHAPDALYRAAAALALNGEKVETFEASTHHLGMRVERAEQHRCRPQRAHEAEMRRHEEPTSRHELTVLLHSHCAPRIRLEAGRSARWLHDETQLSPPAARSGQHIRAAWSASSNCFACCQLRRKTRADFCEIGTPTSSRGGMGSAQVRRIGGPSRLSSESRASPCSASALSRPGEDRVPLPSTPRMACKP